MADPVKLIATFCKAVNLVKKQSLTIDNITPKLYLGGDLGIDSIEMLEIWFCIEKELGIQLDDIEKRDIYTVGQVLERFNTKLQVT